MDGSHSTVEASECAGQHERHEQNPRAEEKHMPGVAQGNNKSEHQDASSRHRKRSHCVQGNAAFLLTTFRNRKI